MDIVARKYHMIEQIMNLDEAGLDKIEPLLESETIDPQVEEKLISRALQSEKDITEHRVHTVDEAEAKINQRLGL